MEKGIWLPMCLVAIGFALFPVAEMQVCPTALFKKSTLRYVVPLYQLKGNPTTFDWTVEWNGETKTVSTCSVSTDSCSNTDEPEFSAIMDNRYVMYFTISEETYVNVTNVKCHYQNEVYLSCPVDMNLLEEVALQLLYPANGTVLKAPVVGNPKVTFTFAGSINLPSLYYRQSGQYEELEKDEYLLRDNFIGKSAFKLRNLTFEFPTSMYGEAFFYIDFPIFSKIGRIYFSFKGDAKKVPLRLVSPFNNFVQRVPEHKEKNVALYVAGFAFRSSFKLYDRDSSSSCSPVKQELYEVQYTHHGDLSQQQTKIALKIFNNTNVNSSYCVDVHTNEEKIQVFFRLSEGPFRLISPANHSELTGSSDGPNDFYFTVAGAIYPFYNFFNTKLFVGDSVGKYSTPVLRKDYKIYTTNENADINDHINLTLRFYGGFTDRSWYHLKLANRLQTLDIVFSIQRDTETNTALIVGLTVGLAVPILLAILFAVLCIRARRNRRNRRHLTHRDMKNFDEPSNRLTSAENKAKNEWELNKGAPPYPGE